MGKESHFLHLRAHDDAFTRIRRSSLVEDRGLPRRANRAWLPHFGRRRGTQRGASHRGGGGKDPEDSLLLLLSRDARCFGAGAGTKGHLAAISKSGGHGSCAGHGGPTPQAVSRT